MAGPTFENGQQVYLLDGRAAEYVMPDGSSHFVRVLLEFEGSYDEPPYFESDERITRAPKVFASPPKEVFAAEISAAKDKLAKVKAEVLEKRRECLEADANRSEIEKAAKKYPEIQQALDFIEGRITHVVSMAYGSAQVLTLDEALTDNNRWRGNLRFDGMKLLCLFGTDASGKKADWRANNYRDGSAGSWVTVLPAKSEAEAKAILQSSIDDAIAEWRAGERMSMSVSTIAQKETWLLLPDDWIADQEAKAAAGKTERIEKLRSQIAELEATP